MTVALKDMDAEFLLTKAIDALKSKKHNHPGELGNLFTAASLKYNGYKITVYYSRQYFTHKLIIMVYDRSQTKKLQDYADEVGPNWIPIWDVPSEIQRMKPTKHVVLTQVPTFDTQFSNIHDWEVEQLV